MAAAVGVELTALAETMNAPAITEAEVSSHADSVTVVGTMRSPTSRDSVVKVTYMRWRRRYVCDIRTWAPHPETGEMAATRKGIQLPIGLVPDLIALLQAAVALRANV